MHEQHDAIGEALRAERRAGLHALTHVDLRLLPGNRRHGRLHAQVVIDGEDLIAVVGAEGGERPASSEGTEADLPTSADEALKSSCFLSNTHTEAPRH